MAHVFARERTWLDPVCVPIERLSSVSPAWIGRHEKHWKRYSLSAA